VEELDEGGFIAVNEQEMDKIHPSKLFYFDTETMVMGFHKDTNEPEPLTALGVFQNNLDDAFYMNNDLEPDSFPFVERKFSEDYMYKQVVNWVEIHSSDGSYSQSFATLPEFVEALKDPMFAESYLVAHYGQGFDFQLLYEELFKAGNVFQGKLKDPVMNGNKIIRGHFFNKISLIDSYNYLCNGLAEFPKMFELQELHKGYFPHLFNIPQFQDYVGVIPDVEWYGANEMKPEKREKFLQWHAVQVSSKVEFNLKEELRAYCHSDVDILRRGFEKFRQMFITLTDLDGNLIGGDPLSYFTIVSLAFDGIYRRHYMEPGSIRYLPRPKKSNYSASSLVWLEAVMKQEGVFIQHAENGGEHLVELVREDNGERFLKEVDGYCSQTRTVYEFHGCFFHSCPKCYHPKQMHPMKKIPFFDKKTNQWKKGGVRHGTNHANTLALEAAIKQAGYTLVTMWECEYHKLRSKTPEIYVLPEDYEMRKALQPRDAYYGGRTNAVKLYHRCEGTERIHYIDVTSMYPTVMSGAYAYPVGVPEIRRCNDPCLPLLPLELLFGLQKCMVSPPSDLYHPVLPCRSKVGKVLFPLYDMTGTWTHVELLRAVSKGYRVVQVYEQHHFPTYRIGLFSTYINTFFEMKKMAEASGNKGLKTVAKLCLNSFYGKWGFNPENRSKVELIREHSELWDLLTGRYNRCSINIINDGIAYANHRCNDEYTQHTKSNVYIAAYVTAYARLKLYDEALDRLGRNVLYFDTDSCVYLSPSGDHLVPPDLSGELGFWTSELPPNDYFVEFVSAGPKTYALKSFSGNHDVCKAKGFSLSYKNAQIMNFDSLKVQVLHKATGGGLIDPRLEYEEDCDPWAVPKLVLHRRETIMRRNQFRIVVEQNPGKVLNMTYDKRVILVPDTPIRTVDTLPFGHRDLAEGVEETKGEMA
jgi:G:T-mismatch repair DNA endonuclease (very short patch repair protein)